MSEIMLMSDLLFANKSEMTDLEYFNCMEMLKKIFDLTKDGGKIKEKIISEEIQCPICSEIYNPDFYPTYL